MPSGNHLFSFSTCDIRLSVGVPLEDVFPHGDLHPSLKRLFNETYKRFLCSKAAHPLQCLTITNGTDTALYNVVADTSLAVMKALTFKKPLPSALSFETLISTLRHYLDSLPLPLMPKYTNRSHFYWDTLSMECRPCTDKRFCEKELDKSLQDKIARNLLRLPAENLLLIDYFTKFLRSLIQDCPRCTKLSLKRANILIQYFSASIFPRPYFQNNSDVYHPLMLFLIVKWPDIQRKCMENETKCFQAQKIDHNFQCLTNDAANSIVTTENFNSVNEYDYQSINTFKDDYKAVEMKNIGCQTDEKSCKSFSSQTQITNNALGNYYNRNSQICMLNSLSDESETNRNIRLDKNLVTLKAKPSITHCDNGKSESERYKMNVTPENIKSSVNMNNSDFCGTVSDKMPLYSKSKVPKRFLNTKIKNGIDLMRRFKDQKLVKQIKIKYNKMTQYRNGKI